MTIGIFTYGTRGDVQPYIALALGLMAKGHPVFLAAPENFKDLIEGYGVNFHELYGNVELKMNEPEGQRVLKTGNSIKLMQYFFAALRQSKVPLRRSYTEGMNKADVAIVNLATLNITAALAERQNKKFVTTYFMPPAVLTSEFPLPGLAFFDFPAYNRLTYKLGYAAYWRFVKRETNELRLELGLPALRQSLLRHIDEMKPLDLYCLSPSLISQPGDWQDNHKITGFLTVPEKEPPAVPAELSTWLQQGPKPVYIGFGSNGIGNTKMITRAIEHLLARSGERILFCTGWTVFDDMPAHPNLFVTKYVNHTAVLPQCKIGVFHGGAGTLAAMLRNNLPCVIVSFYTDQPAWGKIIERKKLGVHIPVKKFTAEKLRLAISNVQRSEITTPVSLMRDLIVKENGLETAVNEIEKYFGLETPKQ